MFIWYIFCVLFQGLFIDTKIVEIYLKFWFSVVCGKFQKCFYSYNLLEHTAVNLRNFT